MIKEIKEFIDMVEKALYRAQNGEASPLYLQAIENLTDNTKYKALKALVTQQSTDNPVKENISNKLVTEDALTIMGLESELDIVVGEIFAATDLARLKEITKKNFPKKWTLPVPQDKEEYFKWLKEPLSDFEKAILEESRLDG